MCCLSGGCFSGLAERNQRRAAGSRARGRPHRCPHSGPWKPICVGVEKQGGPAAAPTAPSRGSSPGGAPQLTSWVLFLGRGDWVRALTLLLSSPRGGGCCAGHRLRSPAARGAGEAPEEVPPGRLRPQLLPAAGTGSAPGGQVGPGPLGISPGPPVPTPAPGIVSAGLATRPRAGPWRFTARSPASSFTPGTTWTGP